MSAPAVSVVIPAYQAQAFIARSVRSVLEQTWSDWELVIVSDDGEDYGAWLRSLGVEDARVRSLFTPGVATGPAMARNVGLDAAAGRFVAALDSDDRLEPSALEILVPLAREHGAAYSRRRLVQHGTEQEMASYDRPLASGLVHLEEVLTSQIHSYAGIVFDRSRVGTRWPATRELWEDVHAYVKCFDDVDHLYYSAEPLYVYYLREGSICNRPETGKEYLESALSLVRRLESQDTLGIRKEASRAVYARYLRGRVLMEERFMEQLAAGQCTSFRDFMSRNPELLFLLG